MNKNNLNTKKRYDLLDAYKLFASIGVISIHCIYQLSSNEWYKPQIRNRPHKMTQRSKR